MKRICIHYRLTARGKESRKNKQRNKYIKNVIDLKRLKIKIKKKEKIKKEKKKKKKEKENPTELQKPNVEAEVYINNKKRG